MAQTGEMHRLQAVVVDAGLPEAPDYAEALRAGGLGEVVAAAATEGDIRRFVTADAVIVLCQAWSAAVADSITTLRSADTGGRVCIVMAAKALDTAELAEAEAAGADGVVLLGPPSPGFYRQVARLISAVRSRRG